MQEIFGSQCKVKLDIFHAVQRVVLKIPKRHPFHSPCARDMGMVFRDDGDHGLVRTKSSPSSEKILANLKSFVAKWKSVVFDGNRVLPTAALVEIEKLKVHINKGCLSEIPTGCGTNRNEVFHRYIRTFFHRSRVGILLAYALMMVIIYQFNSSEGSSRKQLVKPITSCNTISNTTEPMGIVRTLPANSDFTWNQENVDEEIIDHISVGELLQQSVSQFPHVANEETFKYSNRFMEVYSIYSQVVPMFSTMNENTLHKERLKQLLADWRFSVINVPEDENCFFTSVALELSNFSKPTIEKIGLPILAPITALIKKLREMIVEEWLGTRRYLYEEFLTDNSQFERWAIAFKQDSFFDCELGNTMPLAMANALGVSFVIFTSLERSPVYYVTPSSSSTTSSENVLYLAYNVNGSGHYDACIPLTDACTPEKIIKCRCGVNRRERDKENYIACNYITNGRHSTCKCLAAGQPSSSHCNCKDCNNPNGQRAVLGKRKREIHDWQKVNTSNIDFATSREKLVQGCWSKFENILLLNTINR